MKYVGLYTENQDIATKEKVDTVVNKIPTKTSQLTNDSGFLTSAPVSSVNGKTGTVELGPTDLGLDNSVLLEKLQGIPEAPNSGQWKQVIWMNDEFIAFASKDGYVAHSPNGYNWQVVKAYTPNYDNGMFACAYSVSDHLYISLFNGELFKGVGTTASAAISSLSGGIKINDGYISNFAYGNNKLISIRTDSKYHKDNVVVSNSLDMYMESWYDHVIPFNCIFLKYGGGSFVAFASVGNTCATSRDGETWSEITICPETTEDNPQSWYGLAYDDINRVWLAAGSQYTVNCMGGATEWKIVTNPSISIYDLTFVKSTEQFIGFQAGRGTMVAYTNDYGETWDKTGKVFPYAGVWMEAHNPSIIVGMDAGTSCVSSVDNFNFVTSKELLRYPNGTDITEDVKNLVNSLPSVTILDEGKFLQVVNGAWAAV